MAEPDYEAIFQQAQDSVAGRRAETQTNLDNARSILDRINQERGALDVDARAQNYDAQTENAYQQRQLQGQMAQNQFAQNQAAGQMSALDAIRRSNASSIANGANAGLAAANQLSTMLGLQEQTNEGAVNIANDSLIAASERVTQMGQNQITAQGEVDAEMARLGNEEALANAAILEHDAAMNQINQDLETARVAYENAKTEAEAKRIDAESRNQLISANLALQETANSSLDKAISAMNKSGDNFSFVTKYYDPFTGKEMTGETAGNPNGGSKFDKAWAERMNSNIQAELNTRMAAVVNATTPAERQAAQLKLDEWHKEIQKWTNSLAADGAIKNDTCITGDTLITMADGSQKPVKDCVAGDKVLSFNGERNITTTLYTPLEHPASPRTVLTLHFATGATVDTVDGHSFLLADKRKCIALTFDNVKKYIGKEFQVTPSQRSTLFKVSQRQINEPLYSPMAHKNMWLYTNGVLSAAHLTEFIVNARLGKYKAKDLITYEEVPAFIRKDVSKELFDAYDGEMLKVWAKGFRKFFIGRKIKKLIKLLD